MIEIRLIEHALTLADEGSFARAAQLLGIGQPALSRSIQSLETLLGVQLFERNHRRIEPTDAGQAFLERARDLASRHALFMSEMGALRPNGHKTCSLAVGPYVADLVAAPAIAAAVRQYPGACFRLLVDGWAEAIKAVRAREVDLAVADCSQLKNDLDLEVLPLGVNQGYFVARTGHPLFSRRAVSLDEIMRFPLVSTSRLPPRLLVPLSHSRKLETASSGGLPAIICEQISVMRAIVASTDAVGMFTLSHIEVELNAGTLAPLPCCLPWLHTQFGIVYRRNRPLSEELQSLISFVGDAALEHEKRELALAKKVPWIRGRKERG